MLLLQIDCRETKIVELVKSCEFTDYEVLGLPVGDFVLRDTDTLNIHFVVERKCIRDLAASIQDGRFSEQKSRLIASMGDPTKIIYVLEGLKKSGTTGKGGLSKHIIDSAIMNLVFKHQYKILFSESEQDTLDQLLLLHKKINTGDLQSVPKQATLIKKSGGQDIFVNQLCVISGVSLSTAKRIKEDYGCMRDLIEAFRDNKDLLVGIQLGKRKLGGSLNKKIYESLFQN